MRDIIALPLSNRGYECVTNPVFLLHVSSFSAIAIFQNIVKVPISAIQMQHKSHKAGISSACIIQRCQQGYTMCEQVHLSETETAFVCELGHQWHLTVFNPGD